MTRYWGSYVLGPLTHPTYVIRMGQYRMKRSARVKWLYLLRGACMETIQRIDEQLREENDPALGMGAHEES